MAQPALTIRQSRDEELYKTNPDQSVGIGRDCLGERLYFPLETTAMRSLFRDAVLNDIFRTAVTISDGLLESAEVSVWSTPDEEDSLTLDLTLTMDTDWESIKRLRHEINVTVVEWSQEWSEEQKNDYGRTISFGLIPSIL